MDTNQEVSTQVEPTELDPVANPVEAEPSQATAAEGEGDQTQEQEKDKPQRLFTQEELEAAVQKRLAKEARKHSRELEKRIAEMQGQPVAKQREPEAGDGDSQPAQDPHTLAIEAAKKLAPQFAQQLLEQRRQQEQLEKFWERADEVVERFPDFDQAVRDKTFVELSGVIYDFVVDSEVGPEMAYHLSKNRAQARQIHHMSPPQAARALIAIESEMKAKPKAQPSRAPDPINPVGNRGTASRSSMPSDEDDMDTWVRKERERLAKRR